MTNEIKNIPQLRFPNFDGDWEECKLEEISDKVTEKNKNNQFSETLTNSAEYGVISQRDFFDKDISNEKNLNGYYIVQEDDFVYNPRISNFAPVGPIKRNKLGRTGVMSPLYYVFRTRNIDVVFLDYYFETTGWHKFMKLNGDSGARADRFAIKDLIFKTMPIPYPIIEEQEKIGNFFSKLDQQIELEEQKLEKLEEQKKGYMQQIFSQKIRFKDENGNGYPEWEEKKLGEVASVYDGTHQTPKYTNEGIKFLSVENIKTLKSNKYISKEAFDKEFKIRPEYGDVLMTRIGDVGTTNVVNSYDDLAYYVSLALLKPKNMNSYFLESLIQSPKIQNELWRKTLHIAFPKKINKNEIAKVIVNHPKKEEQEKIGNFFRSFDEFLEKQNQKIDRLKERKQGFSQKMFM
ncbi:MULTISPECIES: restriction endonuclease subunit S [Staphylococcus]|uniref:restriction endonuclease subunit S n=1 Tax=Staphylococcus TaxID=1279 RepID=UPI000281E6F8|nr:restriction endonuclease subunit S [Staphylococcus sp. OJ82]EJX19329.1 hypothetical protein SOJ_02680 [Staphylococcus sp. OJ82]MDW4220450.1 restriction endonuclease subunit S [Staphylococcus saprophyticus]MDW4260670.1 restriction endonuclease subunit S [Staphylococcus saprophyticus]